MRKYNDLKNKKNLFHCNYISFKKSITFSHSLTIRKDYSASFLNYIPFYFLLTTYICNCSNVFHNNFTGFCFARSILILRLLLYRYLDLAVSFLYAPHQQLQKCVVDFQTIPYLKCNY